MKTVERPNKATEYALITLAQRGNREALSRLIKAHHAFVYQIAIKYWRVNMHGHFTAEDLAQFGAEGMQKAIMRFDVTRGLKLISYASWWIRQSILKGLGDQADLIRLPINIRDRRKKRPKRTVNNPNVGSVSLDNPNFYYEPYAEDADILTPMGDRQEVEIILSRLSPIERDITKRRYGIGYANPQTLKEIGDDYDLSRERIRQISGAAMRKMQRAAKGVERA